MKKFLLLIAAVAVLATAAIFGISASSTARLSESVAIATRDP